MIVKSLADVLTADHRWCTCTGHNHIRSVLVLSDKVLLILDRTFGLIQNKASASGWTIIPVN